MVATSDVKILLWRRPQDWAPDKRRSGTHRTAFIAVRHRKKVKPLNFSTFLFCRAGAFSSRLQECCLRATAVGNLWEVQRVVYRHDWQCVAEWASALDELAYLTDDEIDGLARSDQQRDTPSACNGYSLPAAGEPPASRGPLQALRQNVGSRLRSGVSKSLALLIPHARTLSTVRASSPSPDGRRGSTRRFPASEG
jgi:hypothetical protein